MSIRAALTDGTGISALTGSKVVKDFVADLLLSIPAVLVAINVTNLETALAAPLAVGVALADATIRVVYRFALRWSQS